jgi:hypothetical protein
MPTDPKEEGDEGAHLRSAWRSWLCALATDAEAALAAALAFESLPAEGRDAWLDALEADAPDLDVPPVALYAPLLAVESDERRRMRIHAAIPRQPERALSEPHALCGVAADGVHACLILAPLYLEFVQVLSCRYTPAGGFVEARLDPMRHLSDVAAVREVDGVAVEPTPLHVVVEELAHAVLADRREGRASPAPVSSFAHLFGPRHDDTEDGAEDGAPSSP